MSIDWGKKWNGRNSYYCLCLIPFASNIKSMLLNYSNNTKLISVSTHLKTLPAVFLMPNYGKEILIETQEIGYQKDTVSKQEIRIYFETLSYYLYLHIFLIQIKVKMCKMDTLFFLAFVNIQYYIAKFIMVGKFQSTISASITSWQYFD